MIRARIPGSAAFTLLTTQLLGGGMVALAHTREPLDAPRRVEAAHHEHCPVLHHAVACVLCVFSQSRAAAPAPNGDATAVPAANQTSTPRAAGLRGVPELRTSHARAPPYSQG